MKTNYLSIETLIKNPIFLICAIICASTIIVLLTINIILSFKKNKKNKEITKDDVNQNITPQNTENVENIDNNAQTNKTSTSVENNTTSKTEANKKSTEKKTTEVKQSKYEGKWIIVKKSVDDFFLCLYNSNQELIFLSERYANIPSAKLGLRTIEMGVTYNQIHINVNKNNQYFYRVKDNSNRSLGISFVYETKKACQSGVTALKKYVAKSVLTNELYEDMTFQKYEHNKESISDKDSGKWIINKIETEYQGKLFYEDILYLVTDNYASTNSVFNAISTYRKNIDLNNFVIDKDKEKGYYFILRNNLKGILCVGDYHETIEECQKEIIDLKKIIKTTEIYEDIESK